MPAPGALIGLAAVICVLMGLVVFHRGRGGRGRTVGGGGGGVGLPLVVAALARVPSPRALGRLCVQPDPAGTLVGAGLTSADAVDVMRRARAGGVMVGVVLGAALAMLATALVLAVPLLAVALRFVPDRLLASRAASRRAGVVRALPDLLDLMVICVEAGMALDPALRMASVRLGGALGDEVAVMLNAQALGTPRRDAYRALAQRVGSDDVGRLVASLLQAEELGTPLAAALAGQGESLRASRRQMARDRAARAAPRIQLVVAMVMVPGALLLVLGVMVVELASQIGGVTG